MACQRSLQKNSLVTSCSKVGLIRCQTLPATGQGSVPSPVLTVHTPERQPRRQGPAWPGDAEVRNQCYVGEEGLHNGADGLIKLSLEIDDVAE